MRRSISAGLLAATVALTMFAGPTAAKITEEPIECQNPSGRTPGGQQPSCTNDNLVQVSENQNPSGKAPPGQN